MCSSTRPASTQHDQEGCHQNLVDLIRVLDATEVLACLLACACLFALKQGFDMHKVSFKDGGILDMSQDSSLHCKGERQEARIP